jgi:hypothetical protein
MLNDPMAILGLLRWYVGGEVRRASMDAARHTRWHQATCFEP